MAKTETEEEKVAREAQELADKEAKDLKEKNKKKDLPFGMSEEQVFSLLKTVEDLKKKDEEREKEIKRLVYAADKARLEKFDARQENKNSLVPTCKVSTWNGKIIVASKMLPQEVYFDSQNIYHEKQEVEMYLQGETVPVVASYKDQFRRVLKLDAQIVGNSTDADGNKTVKVLLKDGRTAELDIAFIN